MEAGELLRCLRNVQCHSAPRCVLGCPRVWGISGGVKEVWLLRASGCFWGGETPALLLVVAPGAAPQPTLNDKNQWVAGGDSEGGRRWCWAGRNGTGKSGAVLYISLPYDNKGKT